MSTIIDHTFFFGKLSLPQVNNTEGRDEVDQFIEIFEPEYLEKAMGYELWKAFSEGIAGSGEPDDRWQKLLDGDEFTLNERLYKFNGFAPENKKSPIAGYVYYRFMEDKCADNTLVGVVTGVVDNNEKTSPAIKMCDAWGEMVRQSNLLFYYLKVNISTYPEFVPSRQSRAEVFHPINDFGI